MVGGRSLNYITVSYNQVARITNSISTMKTASRSTGPKPIKELDKPASANHRAATNLTISAKLKVCRRQAEYLEKCRWQCHFEIVLFIMMVFPNENVMQLKLDKMKVKIFMNFSTHSQIVNSV